MHTLLITLFTTTLNLLFYNTTKMDSYLPLKVPRPKQPLILYYRQHQSDTEDRAIFICNLDKPLKESRVKKWLGVCGKIESVELGHINKPKAVQKTHPGKYIHFAVVIYKKKQSVKRALDNKAFNQKVARLYNSEDIDIEIQPVENEELDEHDQKMEEGGFSMVKPKTSKVQLGEKRPRTE